MCYDGAAVFCKVFFSEGGNKGVLLKYTSFLICAVNSGSDLQKPAGAVCVSLLPGCHCCSGILSFSSSLFSFFFESYFEARKHARLRDDLIADATHRNYCEKSTLLLHAGGFSLKVTLLFTLMYFFSILDVGGASWYDIKKK